MTKVNFVTNIASHYRSRLWLELLRLNNYKLHFFFSRETNSSIKQIDFGSIEWVKFSSRLTNIRNRRFKGILFWQSMVLRLAFKTSAPISVFLGEMNVVSTWFAALILKARSRRVVFWGHGVYGNETGLKKLLRLMFLRMANVNILYGEHAKNLLLKEGFKKDSLHVIYNSLDYPLQKALRSQVVEPNFFEVSGFFEHRHLPVLIFVGRLTKSKRLDFLISSVRLLNSNSIRFNLLLVGDGTERKHLEELSAGDDSWIHFFGECYDEAQLGKLITNSDLCVSPGNVGLTAIHALSFGTPVCTHDDFTNQMPEVEAITDGITGVFFDNKIGNLDLAIESWFDKKLNREEVRASCYSIVDKKYNPINQVEIFCKALDFAK